MKRVPKARHALAVIVFAVVAAFYGYSAFHDPNLSHTQVELATGALKSHQDALYKHDLIFGQTGLWKTNSPILYGLLDMTLVPTAFRDPSLPFRLMTGVLAMIYLCGMYALLYRQCMSWSVAAFVAVLSTPVIYSLGGAFWGIGALGSCTPRGFCVAVTPLILLAYLRYRTQTRLPLVFVAIGLLANIHLVSAMNLTIVLLIVYLAEGRFALNRLPMIFWCALGSLAAALPYVLYYMALRLGAVPPDASASYDLAVQALKRQAMLYPGLFTPLVYWMLLVGAIAIPASTVLLRVERYRVRDINAWLWFLGGAIFVALGLHGISQLLGMAFAMPPLVLDLMQATNLVMVPLYIFLAHAITNLFRIIRSYRNLFRWVCAAFMLAWMLPSDNLQVGRHILYRLATNHMKEEDRPLRIRQIQSRQEEANEFHAIASWARENTHVDSVFLAERGEFRMLARRAIVAGTENQEDARYVYYMAPWKIKDWIWRSSRQAEVLHQPDGKTLLGFINELVAREKLQGVPEWYAILQASVLPQNTQGMEPVASPAWGNHLRLYRLRPEPIDP